ERLLRESLERNKKILGDVHPGVAEFDLELAALLIERGRLDEAESLIHHAWRGFEKLNALNTHGWILETLARTLHGRGDYETAALYLRESLGFRIGDHGREHPITATCLLHLAEACHDSGDLAAAQPIYESALAMLEQFGPPGHPDVLAARVDLAALHLDLGEPFAAEADLRDVLDGQL